MFYRTKFWVISLSVLCAAVIFLGGCSGERQPTVEKIVTYNGFGDPVITYKECSFDRYVQKGDSCYVETIAAQYCYRTIGEIECYTHPLPVSENSRRVR